ncbi:hypothetical protein ACIBCT_24615 [Streptosporangium sp. NPDC050855]|uniref:hypothetical protein n=1 Tax=Streptosporangium sp. NPDC050855 TaxID=3366194 RepID=UPI0037A32885
MAEVAEVAEAGRWGAGEAGGGARDRPVTGGRVLPRAVRRRSRRAVPCRAVPCDGTGTTVR